jgi:plastocyanin
MGASAFSPITLTVAAGGTVNWRNDAGQVHNVTFADPALALAVGGGAQGNIPDHSSGTNSRRFNAGTGFQCTIHAGMTGTVVVN